MPDYLISPPDETEWRLSPEDFTNRLRDRWPEAKLEWELPSSHLAALRFDVPVTGGSVRGRFGREGDALDLENGPLEQLAEVALWFRSEVPSEQRLLFFDEGFNADVELYGDMTVEQLVESYLAADQANRE